MKVGKHAPPVEPLSPALLVQVRERRDEVVAGLVAKAETGAAAWEALAPEGGGEGRFTRPTPEKARAARAEALLQAVHAIGVQVKSGKERVADLKGEPVPASWVERFKELHAKRLDLKWKADAATYTYADWEQESARITSLADEETHKILAGAWPCDEIQALMAGLDWVSHAGREGLHEACHRQVALAVEQVYGAKQVIDG